MYTLDDGNALHEEFPDTFFIPSALEKSHLQKNDTVKLIFRSNNAVERMWVSIKQNPTKKDGLLIFDGVLDNAPYELENLKLGDIVHFTENNIIDIFSPE